MLDHREYFRRIRIHCYQDIISVENLLDAWKEFVSGKRKKKDVQEFQQFLMDNILSLHQDLKNRTYRHAGYQGFKVSDPKPRDIHKATVRDRLLHHAIYRKLYPFFDRTWIADSYSCRNMKGTHRAMDRFSDFSYKVSKNYTKTCWVLKCDIKKFFASIDHRLMMSIFSKHILDPDTRSLIADVVGSFQSTGPGKGLPLGNLTSQLLVNIYMNEFDQFAKHRLKAKYYIRYADDFVFMHEDRHVLEELITPITSFLRDELGLSLHPKKVYIATFSSGIDFLGWVHFPRYRVVRTSTERRMLRNLKEDPNEARLQSYRGLLSHGNGYKLSTRYLMENHEKGV